MTTTIYDNVIGSGSGWASFNSTVSPSGTPGSFAGSGTVYYKILGKTVFFFADLAVATLSTGSGTLDFTVPVTVLRNGVVFMGINKSTGHYFYAQTSGGSVITFNCLADGGNFPVTADGQFLSVSGTYESI